MPENLSQRKKDAAPKSINQLMKERRAVAARLMAEREDRLMCALPHRNEYMRYWIKEQVRA